MGRLSSWAMEMSDAAGSSHAMRKASMNSGVMPGSTGGGSGAGLLAAGAAVRRRGGGGGDDGGDDGAETVRVVKGSMGAS